jgi:hypothetical protein
MDGDAGDDDATEQQQHAASGTVAAAAATELTSSSAARAKAPVPANVANIRFLCPDGRSRELQFPISTRIFTIKQELHKSWPAGACAQSVERTHGAPAATADSLGDEGVLAEWKDNQVSTWQQVRLLLRGRFLDDQYTLISASAPGSSGGPLVGPAPLTWPARRPRPYRLAYPGRADDRDSPGAARRRLAGAVRCVNRIPRVLVPY